MARELHDSTGQMLAALKINLDVVSSKTDGVDEETKSLVADSLVLTEEMSRQLRTMSYLLHPPLLDETGLQSALSWYTEGFSLRSGIKVELEVSPEIHRLPPEIEIALFRVVQESLTNIHRHSKSTTALIRLLSSQDQVHVEITDTGKQSSDELPGKAFRPGVGIMGMHERMRQIGGDFSIATNEEGTTIRASAPLKSSLRDQAAS